MISSPTNLPQSLFPLNKGIPKGWWQYGSKNMKIYNCKYSREEIARDRYWQKQCSFGVPSIVARYPSAICSLFVRYLFGPEPDKYRTSNAHVPDKSKLDDLRLSPHFTLAELTKTSVKTKDGNIPSHVHIENLKRLTG